MKTDTELQNEILHLLGAEEAFDVSAKNLFVGGRRGKLIFIAGYVDVRSVESVLSSLMKLSPEDLCQAKTPEDLAGRYVPYGSCEHTGDPAYAAGLVLRGCACLVLEGFSQVLLLDVRSFLVRSIDEPEKDRTLRGPHIGTNESLVSNLVQIRRHLRCGTLRAEKFLLGKKIPNEVALLSLKGKADEEFLAKIREKLRFADVPNLSMTQAGLAAILFPRKRLSLLNPLPKVRYTERPDVVASSLMEGKIALICDNSPLIILLPQSLFDFFEEVDDYYFPPMTATYLRVVRLIAFLGSIFVIPIWLLVVQNDAFVPDPFRFILADRSYSVPLFLQFMIIEIAIDGLKMASLNTPSTLSNSFSVIGGLLLGEFAVESGWFVPQAILYSAFTGVANFIPTNIEVGYSFKFMRISLILLVEFLGLWGFLGGVLFWILVLAFSKGVGGKSYLYPFIPFDRTGVKKILLRTVSGREREEKAR